MKTPGEAEPTTVAAPAPAGPVPDATPAAVVLRLQRSAGNAAVTALLQRHDDDEDGGGVAAPARPTVRFGSRGPAVVDVQQRLNTADPPAAPPLVDDGIFGPLTRTATVDFQRAAELEADGIVGPLTHAALDARRGGGGGGGPLSPAAEEDAVAFNSAVYDARSIRIIQGQVGIAPTGIFDGATAQAVARFQAQRGIPADGKVENPTLAPMLTERAAVAMHDQAIHLVVDFNDLDLSDTLSVHFDGALSPPPLSALRFETGNLRLITVGAGAFNSPTVLRDEIRARLQVAAPAPGAPSVAPATLNPIDAQITALLNSNRLGEPKSVRIIQGLVGAVPDGVWSGELVQRIAGFQAQRGFPAHGLVEDRQTLPAMSAELIGRGDHDAILHVIVDFYDFRDNGSLISIFFNPSIGTGRVAFAFVRRDAEQPASIQVGPNAFTQPFEGLVHTIAHEMEHIRQLVGGPAASATREFLAHAIGVMADGIPEEAIEQHDQMSNPRPPFGFANNARRTVAEWNRMPGPDQVQHRARFVECHDKVFDRIREGTPEAVTHAGLLAAWRTAFAALPTP